MGCKTLCPWILWYDYFTILLQTEIQDEDKKLLAAVDYYFIQYNGDRFMVGRFNGGVFNPFNPS